MRIPPRLYRGGQGGQSRSAEFFWLLVDWPGTSIGRTQLECEVMCLLLFPPPLLQISGRVGLVERWGDSTARWMIDCDCKRLFNPSLLPHSFSKRGAGGEEEGEARGGGGKVWGSPPAPPRLGCR